MNPVYRMIGILLVGGISLMCVLGLGDPQWNGVVYRFQAHIWPGYPRGIVPRPQDYTGIWRHWNAEGELKSVQHFENGLLSGKAWKKYNEDLILAGTWADSVPVGARLLIRLDGSPHSVDIPRGETEIRDDSLYIQFHNNGRVAKYGRFKSGYQSGVWVEFDETGMVVSSKTLGDQQVLLSEMTWSQGRPVQARRINQENDLIDVSDSESLKALENEHRKGFLNLDVEGVLSEFGWVSVLKTP